MSKIKKMNVISGWLYNQNGDNVAHPLVGAVSRIISTRASARLPTLHAKRVRYIRLELSIRQRTASTMAFASS